MSKQVRRFSPDIEDDSVLDSLIDKPASGVVYDFGLKFGDSSREVGITMNEDDLLEVHMTDDCTLDLRDDPDKGGEHVLNIIYEAYHELRDETERAVERRRRELADMERETRADLDGQRADEMSGRKMVGGL